MEYPPPKFICIFYSCQRLFSQMSDDRFLFIFESEAGQVRWEVGSEPAAHEDSSIRGEAPAPEALDWTLHLRVYPWLQACCLGTGCSVCRRPIPLTSAAAVSPASAPHGVCKAWAPSGSARMVCSCLAAFSSVLHPRRQWPLFSISQLLCVSWQCVPAVTSLLFPSSLGE